MCDHKRLLILGGSEFQVPLVEEAKKMGFFVGLIDINPRAPGSNIADVFFNESIKDKEKVLEIAKHFKPDGITTGITDSAVQTCSYVASVLEKPGIDIQTSVRCTDKYEMIKCLESNNVPHPRYELYKVGMPKHSNIGYPAIVKPTNLAGSKGIVLVNSDYEFSRAVNKLWAITRADCLLVEEYMVGPEVSVEMVIVERLPYVVQVTDKTTTGPPHFIEIAHSQPSQLPEDVILNIKNVAIDAVKAVGLINSVAHVEIKVTSEGAKIVELGARPGGGSIGEQLVRSSTGVNFQEIVINFALNKKVIINDGERRYSRILFIMPKKGILKSIRGVDDAIKIPGVIEAKITAEVGKLYDEAKSNSERIGYIIASGNSSEEVDASCSNALRKIELTWL